MPHYQVHGETAAKLRIVFDTLSQTRASICSTIHSIGSARGRAMTWRDSPCREQFPCKWSNRPVGQLIVAATNDSVSSIPRFSVVSTTSLNTSCPNQERIVATLKAKPAASSPACSWRNSRDCARVSFADITRACEEAIKDSLIHGIRM